jgi:hypothetical protein
LILLFKFFRNINIDSYPRGTVRSKSSEKHSVASGEFTICDITENVYKKCEFFSDPAHNSTNERGSERN